MHKISVYVLCAPQHPVCEILTCSQCQCSKALCGLWSCRNRPALFPFGCRKSATAS